MKTIDFILTEQTYSLRHQVLRPHEPIEFCRFPLDNEASTFHVGKFSEEKIVSISTYTVENPGDKLSSWIKAQSKQIYPSYRLRGVATDPDFRRKGFAKEVFQFGEAELIQRKVQLIWFNARQKAFDFYLSQNCKFFGDEFEIKGSGPHKVMYKLLNQS